MAASDDGVYLPDSKGFLEWKEENRENPNAYFLNVKVREKEMMWHRAATCGHFTEKELKAWVEKGVCFKVCSLDLDKLNNWAKTQPMSQTYCQCWEKPEKRKKKRSSR